MWETRETTSSSILTFNFCLGGRTFVGKRLHTGNRSSPTSSCRKMGPEIIRARDFYFRVQLLALKTPAEMAALGMAMAPLQAPHVHTLTMAEWVQRSNRRRRKKRTKIAAKKARGRVAYWDAWRHR